MSQIVRTAAIAVSLLGTGAIVAVTTTLLPVPQAGGPRSAAEVAIPASDTLAVCPGPLAAPSVAGGTDEEFEAGEFAEQRQLALTVPVREGSPAAVLDVLGLGDADGEADAATPSRVDDESGGISQADLVEGFAVRGTVTGSTPAQVQGAQLSRGDAGDVRGLAAMSCQVPASQQWLVGGSTAIGATTTLVLGNPGDAPAEVDLRVLSASGEVSQDSSESILVAPGETRRVLLGGLAPEVPDLAVGVVSRGAVVSAALEQTVLDGLKPAGVEVTGAAAEPAGQLVIPAVSLVEDAPEAAIRIANPGGEPADVDIEVRGPEGPVDWTTQRTSVPAEGVASVPLEGLAAGQYQISLRTSGRIVAAASSTRTTPPQESDASDEELERADTGADDFAWSPSAAPLSGQHLLPLPAADSARLLLGSGEAEEPQTVRIAGVDDAGRTGSWQDIEVEAGAVQVIDLHDLLGPEAAGALLDVDPEADVRGGALLGADDDRMIAALAIPEAPAGVGSRSVRVQG